MRPRELIKALDKPSAVSESDPRHELVLTLIAHVLHADRGLSADELELVAPLTPGVQDRRAYLKQLCLRPLDLEQVANSFPDPVDRKDLLELAEHYLWCDGLADEAELNMVDRLALKLGLLRA